jgi:guanylate kinase
MGATIDFISGHDPVLVIIGPSGSGKSSAVQELVRRGAVEVTPSWTTRPPRHGETAETVEHVFVSDKVFDESVGRGEFLEVVQMFGLPYRYGLPTVRKPAGGKVPLIMLRAPLVPLLPKHFPTHVIYQIEDSEDRVMERLKNRREKGEEQGTRATDFEKEIALGRERAHRLFMNNADIDVLADELQAKLAEDFEL